MTIMRVNRLNGTLLALTLTSLAACAGDDAGSRTMTAETVATGGQCGGSRAEPQLKVATSEADYAEFLDTGARAESDAPAPNFEQQVAVFMAMGQKPTGGYRLSLRDKEVTIEQGTATIPVTWQSPPSDAMVTQALTSPCLVVTLPRGDYQQIRAVDGDGNERLRARLD